MRMGTLSGCWLGAALDPAEADGAGARPVRMGTASARWLAGFGSWGAGREVATCPVMMGLSSKAWREAAALCPGLLGWLLWGWALPAGAGACPSALGSAVWSGVMLAGLGVCALLACVLLLGCPLPGGWSGLLMSAGLCDVMPLGFSPGAACWLDSVLGDLLWLRSLGC